MTRADPDVVALATAMEELPEDERDRRIRLAGKTVIDLREVFSREQQQQDVA